MEFTIPPKLTIALAAALLLATLQPVRADQQYATAGDDVYRVASAGIVSHVVYTGTQRLTVEREGKQVRFEAHARYRRQAPDGTSDARARFVQVLLPGGSFDDRVDDDPDFLTILNQPFAVQLDPTTLRDVRELHGQVPFDATSPLGGDAVLRGFLRPGISGKIDGRNAVAVRFEAEGPMAGPLPDRTGATVSGRMHMVGTAYYALDGALLLALDATLTIVAHLHSGTQDVPVQIIYRRSIRAAREATPIPKTPLPTPLPTGAGTASPAVR